MSKPSRVGLGDISCELAMLALSITLLTTAYALALETVAWMLLEKPSATWRIYWGVAAILACGVHGSFGGIPVPVALGPLEDPSEGLALRGLAGIMLVLWPTLLIRWEFDVSVRQALGSTVLIHAFAVAATYLLLFAAAVACAAIALLAWPVASWLSVGGLAT